MTKAPPERRYLVELVKATNLFLQQLDVEMRLFLPSPDRGKRIAIMSNALEMAKDRARFFGLNIDFRTGKKRKP